MEKTEINVEQVAIALKLLGDKSRLTIVGLLKDNECCVCEFVEVLQMSQPAVSQHLRKLRDAGMIKEQRKGQWMFYKLNTEHEAFDLISEILQHMPDQKEKIATLEKAGKRIQCD
ncbi:helix-turn-helix transcriptional regulator [Thalassobacillus sp. CUG 92003]|uniref:ArsR/SmtB family transcription factor n=1 Tax=Thalassobacillus sp. CUG 92003 TaxID=2736641 RepID=UPI0015E77C2B|nr:metalloregulator ArsR/SmtB family transcription factor [Thalassobacillus sp. CUG 92003]